MGQGKGDSFKPEVLKTADGKDVIYYAVWDSCSRPDPENLMYKCEQLKNSIQIIATNLKNSRVHYVGTEQKMDRSFKLLMEKEDGKLEAMEAKFYRFKPVVQPPDGEMPVASVQENREELLKFTSKRMQKMDSARKRRAIGVGVDDALKLKKVKFAESSIKGQTDEKKTDSESSQMPQDQNNELDSSRSIDDLIKDIINQDAKKMSDLFNSHAVMSSKIESQLKEYVKNAASDSLCSPYFQDVFTKCKTDEHKALAVFGDALVTISKITLGNMYEDDPLIQLQEPQVKNELLKRFTEQTTAGSSSTRQRLKWLVTEKSKDLMTALIIIVMYKLSGKKYLPVTSVTKLLSTSARKVVRVSSLMNCRFDRSSSGQELYFQLPDKTEKTESQKVKRTSRGRTK